MRIRRVAALVAAILTLSGLAQAPAQAEGAVSFDDSVGVLFDGCDTYGFSYDFVEESGFAASWDLDGTLFDSLGDTSDFVFETGDGSAASGFSTVLICGYEPAGVYTLDLTITWYDVDFTVLGSDVGQADIFMRQPRTRTTLRLSDATPKYRTVVRFRIGSALEHPNGYFANQFASVYLQRWRDGAWRRVRGSATFTNENGVAVLRFRILTLRPTKIRAVTSATSDNSSSASRPRILDAHR